MSWLLNLYHTYLANSEAVGVIDKKHDDREYTLLPVAHTTQNAHITVLVTPEGEFHNAWVNGKAEMNTLIPATEKSASRAGAVVAPYPLHDKLSYVAGDLVQYSSNEKASDEPFNQYINQLGEWAASPHAVDKVKSIYAYLSKRHLIRDLVNERVLFLDENDRLLEQWDKKYESDTQKKPDLFSIIAGEQESAFVRFDVHSTEASAAVWRDKEMYDSFINYYNGRLGDEDFCYVTGKMLPGTERHANKIRHAGDKAKLISANDTSGFTFRGRFVEAKDAASISYVVSQKAHNALKWLINRQGKTIDQRVFLVWGNNDPDVPDISEDTFSFIFEDEVEDEPSVFTDKPYAVEFSKAMDGYRNKLNKNHESDINILVLDSATTGRLAVLYYRNMNKELYLNKLQNWHSENAWLHRYRRDNKEIGFYGAPATKDIAFAAYGPNASDKAIKGLMERMLPCVVDGQKIPSDIVRSACNRASNPVSMETWEWEKTLSIACFLANKKEGYEVALDENNEERDYLFGRLLAIADVMERKALGFDEKRSTNAIRYMNAFSRHPERTWGIIQASLQPHQAKMGTGLRELSGLIDDVATRIPFADFNNRPLSSKYLLGYYSQRHALNPSKAAKKAGSPDPVELTQSEEQQ